MQTKFIKYCNYALLFATLCIVSTSLFFTSCNKEKEDTNLILNSFGPMPIARGSELKFIGKNLDKVTAVVLPDGIEITTFNTKTSDLLTITVPQEAVPGLVVLKTPQGDITTKTEIGFSEPISIAGFSPTTIKSGSELTITGDYLNLVKEVIFTERATVAKVSFISQSRTEIKLNVPALSKTGKIAVSDGAEDPVIVYSLSNLTVILPAFTSITPNPVKAGTQLTITGTDLNLVKTVVLGGDKNVITFVSQSATQIVLNVPADSKDGKVKLTPASMVNVESVAELVMVVPTVSVTPTSVKNGADITVTGTNLDLVDKVVFGGNTQGVIKVGGTGTQILVTVPNDAITGLVTFVTKATKEVAGPSLTIIDPVFTSFSPASATAKTDITIDGTDLDLAADVAFVGGVKGTIGAGRTDTQLTVFIPVGAKTGKVTLITKNGNQIQSATDLTILANLPDITSYTEASGGRGKILTINGTNMLLIKQLIFPGNITASEYGTKTDTKVEVYVPTNTPTGYGTIKLFTYEGEEGITPELFISGTDPVVDPSLMINGYDETGHDLGWDNWGGVVALGSDPAFAISGKYMVGTNSNVNGWTWIWGCNHSQLPKPSATKADHVLKLDVNISKKFTSSNFSFTMKLAGTDIDIGHLGLLNADGSYSTSGWITVTIDLASFAALPAVIPSSGDWGMTLLTADPLDLTGMHVDNIRFEHK